MDAERKVIAGLFPVTTTKAVYIDGTNKTLQEAINNGEAMVIIWDPNVN